MFKKAIATLLVMSLLFSFTACGQTTSSTDLESSEASKSEASEAVKVDEKLLSVDITLPASYFEEESEDEIKSNAAEQGIDKCVINSDGSVTYTMTKTKQKELLDNMAQGINESIDSLLNGEDAVESFISIDYSNNFDSFDIYVDSSKYGMFDAFYMLSFYLEGYYYQLFDGVPDDKIDVKVQFIDNATKEVVDSGSFKEWRENIDSEAE